MVVENWFNSVELFITVRVMWLVWFVGRIIGISLICQSMETIYVSAVFKTAIYCTIENIYLIVCICIQYWYFSCILHMFNNNIVAPMADMICSPSCNFKIVFILGISWSHSHFFRSFSQSFTVYVMYLLILNNV